MNNKNKKIEYRLILSESYFNEVGVEYNYKSYSNVKLSMRMREYFQNIIDKNDLVKIPDTEGEFNLVRLEVEYAEE